MTTLFNYDPYYDDFNEDKNFLRILFRPGYAIQARELTQLQTILANQIEKFGNHIFKSGSPIIGGKVSLDRKCNYVKLKTQFSNQDIDISQFRDKFVVIYNSTRPVRAKVLTTEIDGGSPYLVLKYLDGGTFQENDIVQIFGQNIYAEVESSDATGGSFVASIQEGVYYYKGHFVKVIPQFVTVKLKYRIGNSSTINSKPSCKIGIQFSENIIDEIDDTSLLDPAQGAFNYQAPGAERFQIETTLVVKDLNVPETSLFFEVLRLVDDIKTKEVDYPIYSEIEKTLARRTYDESGNYTVDPFIIRLDEGDSANGKFSAVLDPGKAYVSGFEFQTISPTKISLDRGRDTANVSDYSVATSYDSTIALSNIYGSISFTEYPEYDIHSVPFSNIDRTTVDKYNSTKIGSLRVNMMRYRSASNTQIGNTHVFTSHVFDVKSSPITGTLLAGSTSTAIRLPTSVNYSVANSHANMYFRITDGTGLEVSPRYVTESNTAGYIILDTALPFTPGANTFSLESDFKNAESLSYTGTSNVISSGANIHSDSKSSDTGYAFINEPLSSSLLFETRYDSIQPNTLDNVDLFAWKKYSGTTESNGLVLINPLVTDTFDFLPGTGTGALGDEALLNNIICVAKNNSNTSLGIYANSIISLANNNFTVSKEGTGFKANLIQDNVSVDFYVKTKLNNTEDNQTITKKFISSNNTNYLQVPYEMASVGAANLGSAITTAPNDIPVSIANNGLLFPSIGSFNFTESIVLEKLRTPGVAVSLQISDVYEIVRITDSKSLTSNVTTAMLSSSSYDITDNYEFDNGQRKTHYDHATIKLKRGVPAPRGRVYVQFRYFKAIVPTAYASGGVITVDSYTASSLGSGAINYSGISYFSNEEDNKLTSLKGAFDFRPIRDINSNTLSKVVNVDPLSSITSNFHYYLGRIDRIVVKPSKEFAVVKGVSDINPLPPAITDGDMLIYTLTIPPYTESVKDVRVDFTNHRRYTMRDIGGFEERINQLEYYVALTSLEKDATSLKILDSNNLDRAKYGIVVDNFTSKDVQATRQDVGFDNRNLIQDGNLLPASLMRTVKLDANNASYNTTTKLIGNNIKVVGTGTKKAFIMNYSTTPFTEQPYATKSLVIAGALFGGFKGTTKLFPEYTGDVDTGFTASVTLNSLQGIDNAFRFVNNAFKYIADNNKAWAEDRNSPFAQIETELYHKMSTSGPVRGEITSGQWLGGRAFGNVQAINELTLKDTTYSVAQKQIKTSTSQVDVGTFVTDLAIQPYMKSRQVLFSSRGLRPNTRFYHFFDDVEVNNYIVVPNKVTLNANSVLISGETVLIANTTSDLTANITSYQTGGANYRIAQVAIDEFSGNNVHLLNMTELSSNNKYIYGVDSGKYYQIKGIVDHKSGRGEILTANTIRLSTDASSTQNVYVSNNINIVVDINNAIVVGETYNVASYDATTKIVTLEGNTSLSPNANVVYSIETNMTNQYGQLGGAFYIPPATFFSGQRTFRVTESFNNTYDADAVSFADKVYVASGITQNKTTLVDSVLNVDVDSVIVGERTKQTVESTRQIGSEVLSWWVVDPLAQTFFVDSQVYPNGLYLSSVDLCFYSKDDKNLPVTVQIRPTVNGFPSADYWYPESVVTLNPEQIKVNTTSPSFDNSDTYTTFNFDFPVYLKPGLYALVVLSNSPLSSVWIAEKGRRSTSGIEIGVQPYLGTLYKSQNSMEYVPFLNEDLMFRLNRCVFTTGSGSVTFFNEALPSKYNVDKVRLTVNSINPTEKSTNITYRIAGNTVGGSAESTFRSITPFATYSYSTDNLYSVGNRRKIVQYVGDYKVEATLSTTSSTISPILSAESMFLNVWENFIDNAEINPEDFTIINDGASYANSNVVTITATVGSGATAKILAVSGNVQSINVQTTGSGYVDDIIISYPITPNVTANASIVLNSELDPSGGPCLARYITKPIVLAEGYDAGDLRVFLAANKPEGTELHVYYKVWAAGDSTRFNDRPYVRMVCSNPNRAPNIDEVSYNEYEYRPSLTDYSITYTSDSGVTYDTFKKFSIKIVMISKDPAIVPKIRDLRIIAVPSGD